nr:DUF4386 domain-containing protein [Sporosarcina sp. ANT_H38]
MNLKLALWQVYFRFLEAVIISVLSLLTLTQNFLANGAANPASYQVAGILLIAIHDWTFILGPFFMLGINTIMYSYIFYKSKLVPRPIFILGRSGAVMVFINALLVLFDVVEQFSTWGILALPIAAFEMILAVWLLVKVFNESAIFSLSRIANDKRLAKADRLN